MSPKAPDAELGGRWDGAAQGLADPISVRCFAEQTLLWVGAGALSGRQDTQPA